MLEAEVTKVELGVFRALRLLLRMCSASKQVQVVQNEESTFHGELHASRVKFPKRQCFLEDLNCFACALHEIMETPKF